MPRLKRKGKGLGPLRKKHSKPKETGVARFIDEEDDSFSFDEHYYSADDSLSPMLDSDFAEDTQPSFSSFASELGTQTKQCAEDYNGIFHTEHVSGILALADREGVSPVYARSSQVRTNYEAAINNIKKESHNELIPASGAIHGGIPCVDSDPARVETTQSTLKRNVAVPVGVAVVENNKTKTNPRFNKTLETKFDIKAVPAQNKDIDNPSTPYVNLKCKSQSPTHTDFNGRKSCRSDKNGTSISYIVANTHKDVVTYRKVAGKSDHLLKGNSEKDKENVRKSHATGKCESYTRKNQIARNTDESNNHRGHFKQTSKSSKHSNSNNFETADTQEKYNKVVRDRDIENRVKTLLNGRYIKIQLKDIMSSQQTPVQTQFSDRNNSQALKDDNIERCGKESRKEVLKNNCVKHAKVMFENIMKDKEIANKSSNNNKVKVKIETPKAKRLQNKAKHVKNNYVVNNEHFNGHSRKLVKVRHSAAKCVNSECVEDDGRTISKFAVQPKSNQCDPRKVFSVTAASMEDTKGDTNEIRTTRIRKKTPKALALEQLEKTKNYRRYLLWFMRQQKDKREALVGEKGIKRNRDAKKQEKRNVDEVYKLNESESTKKRRLRIKNCIMNRFSVKQYSLLQRYKQRQNYINTLRHQKPYPVLLIKATWNYWRTQENHLNSDADDIGETEVEENESGALPGMFFPEKPLIPNSDVGHRPYFETVVDDLKISANKALSTGASLDLAENEETPVLNEENVLSDDLSGDVDIEKYETFTRTRKESCESVSYAEQSDLLTAVKTEPESPADSPFTDNGNEHSLVVEENELYTVTTNEPSSPVEPLVHSREYETFIINGNNISEVVEQTDLYTVIRNCPQSPAESFSDFEGNGPFTVDRNESFTGNGNERIDPCVGVEENEQYTFVKAEPLSPSEPSEHLTCDEFSESLTAGTDTVYSESLTAGTDTVYSESLTAGTDTVYSESLTAGTDTVYSESLTAGTDTDSCTSMQRLPVRITEPANASYNKFSIPVSSPITIFGKSVHLPYSGYIGDHKNIQGEGLEQISGDEEIDVVSVDPAEEIPVSAHTGPNSGKLKRKTKMKYKKLGPIKSNRQRHFYCISYIKAIHNYCIPVHDKTV